MYAIWDVGYTTNLEMYGLSVQLSQDMAEWNAFWERHFDPFEGWDDHGSRERWRRDGERIAACLRREVASFADVQYEPGRSKMRPRSRHHQPTCKKRQMKLTVTSMRWTDKKINLLTGLPKATMLWP